MVRILRAKAGSRPLGQKFFATQWGRRIGQQRAARRSGSVQRTIVKTAEKAASELFGVSRGPSIYHQRRSKRRRVSPWFRETDFVPPHSLGVFPTYQDIRKDFRTYTAIYRDLKKYFPCNCHKKTYRYPYRYKYRYAKRF